MQSAPSPARPYKQKPWDRITDALNETLENDRQRLEAEAGLLGLEAPLGWIQAPLLRASDERNLSVFRNRNPEIEISEATTYELALGVLRMFADQ